MTDPSDRTYPTTITRFSTATIGTAPASAVTVDRITYIDPWPVSPTDESYPYTMTQTRVTARTILPPSSFISASTTAISAISPSVATPVLPSSTTTMTALATYILWQPSYFDLDPAEPPGCLQPGDCAPARAVKPSRCEGQGRETRCAVQCEYQDYLFFCLIAGTSKNGTILTPTTEDKPQGRVCIDKDSGKLTQQLLEPCDHTDVAPWCKHCEAGPDQGGADLG